MGNRVIQVGLSRRERNILKAIVHQYVRTGRPVGSRKVAKLDEEGLSAATVRNVMASLEKIGFLTQPHTSAGRVPTDKGYRFYVDSLLETRMLSDREVNRIRRSLEPEVDPGKLMSRTSQILSSLSSNIGFVLGPPLSLTTMKRIAFIKISQQRISVILVTHSGLVQHRLIHVDKDLSQDELDQASGYLVENFAGKTLMQIRDDLVELMKKEKALYDRMMKNVILLGSAGLKAPESAEEESEVYFGRTSQIIERLELEDISLVKVLFDIVEKKKRLVKIITECLNEEHKGTAVMIGLGRHIPGMSDWALVSSPYLYNRQIIGHLGVLGPARMEYGKAISLVDYVAKLFGQLISRSAPTRIS